MSSQTNAIIIRIRRESAAEFERLFEEEELPIWKDFHSQGKLLAASLTRVEYGVEEEDAKKGDYVAYILYAVMKDKEGASPSTAGSIGLGWPDDLPSERRVTYHCRVRPRSDRLWNRTLSEEGSRPTWQFTSACAA
jgi:hypothetical protein